MVALAVAVAAEIKINPFGTQFRFGLGVPAYTFALLMIPTLPIIPTGLAAAIAVLSLRVVISSAIDPGVPLAQWLSVHLPGALYYLELGIILALSGLRRAEGDALGLGLRLAIGDALANVAEILTRHEINGITELPRAIAAFAVVGIIRSTMVMGPIFMVRARQQEMLRLQEQRKYQELVMLITGLRTETYFLGKLSDEIEQTMAKAYLLYRNLSERSKQDGAQAGPGLSGLAEEALAVAREIHEVKKDYQRIAAGLEKLIVGEERSGPKTLSEIVRTVVSAHEAYAGRLEKVITFEKEIWHDFETGQHHALISILNNLISNAVEAIDRKGTIRISCRKDGADVVIAVSDTGCGIAPEDRDLIFRPGFTTKFDPETGQYSAGIGLAHVKALTDGLGGRIAVESGEWGTAFILRVPAENVAGGAIEGPPGIKGA